MLKSSVSRNNLEVYNVRYLAYLSKFHELSPYHE